ncbi:hypothetical protein KQI84_01745 [bacterium]|nr:hypothetical protein [bacterium]
MQTPDSQVPESSPLRRAIFPFAGLWKLCWLRLIRAWRWRAALLVSLIGAYIMDSGMSFGPGAAVAFPGGEIGIRAFSIFFTTAALVLGVDLVGQLDRHFARRAFDARPLPGLSVQAARCLAVAAALLIPAAVVTIFPFASPFNDHGKLLVEPSLVLFACVLAPLILAGASAGVFMRSFLPNDGAALITGGILLVPVVWHRLMLSHPEEILTTASRSLGLLVPSSLLIQDAVVCLLAAGLFLGLAVLTVRRVRPATPLRRLDPPKGSFLPSARRALGFVGRCFRAPLPSLAGAFVLILAGLLAVATYATMRPVPEFDPDWTLLTQPSAATRGQLLPPRIMRRDIDIPDNPAEPYSVSLTLNALHDQPQVLAAVTFGPTVDLVGIDRDGGEVQVVPTATSPKMYAYALRFDPPLSPDSGTEVTFQLKPKPSALRLWERTRHPVFASFQSLPYWYGEGAAIDYAFENFNITEQGTPFEIALPDVEPRRWFAGAAVTFRQNGRQTVESRAADVPRGLFAAELVTVRAAEGSLDVQFVVFPEHKELAEGLEVAYARRFDRLRRAFGQPPAPLVYYEVPQANPRDPMAISSAELDRLNEVLEDYSDYENPTAGQFDEAFARLHFGAVTRMFAGSFAGFEHPELLRDAWIEYLDGLAFNRGQTRLMTRMGRDFIFVPWDWQHREGRFPFDLTPQQEPGFRGPMLKSDRPPNLVPVPQERRLAFHHMLRGVLGDDEYAQFLRTLIDQNRAKILTLAAVKQTAEATAGKDLGWFFDQWLRDGVVPQYDLSKAQVILAENPETRELEYTTRVVLKNEGDGRMPVPVVLSTESDEIRREFDVTAGEEVSITFVTRDRPISVSADPDGWIVQMPEFDELAKRPVHPQVLLKTVKEL